MAHETLLVETRGRVGLITLNRPQALNALNRQLLDELRGVLAGFEADAGIGAVVLTGRMMDAAEAERSGLVARVVAPEKLLEEALAAAEKIAGFSLPSTIMAKEAVNRAYETVLSEGMRAERRLFHALFATEDQKEGMTAFIEKRKPAFRHR